MISVTLLTKNCEKYLDEVLRSLEPFDEVLIYDTGSTDRTLSIAGQFPNVVIHKGVLQGFGPTHNLASSLAKHDWILSIDSDEVVTKEMATKIRSLVLNPKAVYRFPRHNYYNGKWIRGCGWYPDRQKRLYNRQQTQFCNSQVHESVQTQGMELIDLETPFKHYSYEKTADFLLKMQTYSTLFAEQNRGKKEATMWTAISHAIYTFMKCYFLQKGFLCGSEGFIISIYNANTAFYKYLKLREINREPNP